jgi:hypothetical protein
MTTPLPYKSVAAALLFSVILGPVGLLYASFIGGLVMIPMGIVMVCGQYYFLTLLVWLISCVWSVGAVEKFNRQLSQSIAR